MKFKKITLAVCRGGRCGGEAGSAAARGRGAAARTAGMRRGASVDGPKPPPLQRRKQIRRRGAREGGRPFPQEKLHCCRPALPLLTVSHFRQPAMSEEPEGVAAGDSGGGEVKKTGTKGLGKGAARGRGRGKVCVRACDGQKNYGRPV